MRHTETLSPLLFQDVLQRALAEDLGLAGDVTVRAAVAPNIMAEAKIVTRQRGVIAGLPIAAAAFAAIDPAIIFTPKLADGAIVEPQTVIATIAGPAGSILTGERTALNFLTHLSGIATATAQMVEATFGTKARITCTRKTLPGLRAVQKYAVRVGGGFNHRFSLADAIMIKDNHIVAAGGITKAIQMVHKNIGHMVTIEVEVDNLDQLKEALTAGAKVILCDNMQINQLEQAVALNNGRALLEASGRIRPDMISAISKTGVDYISSGWLTHSAPACDIGLDFSA